MSELKKSAGSNATPAAQDYRRVRAPRGTQLSCAGWAQEAALRMLMNSLDEEVAEQPRDLIACGSAGRVLSDWDCYHAIVGALKALGDNETLLVQSGRLAGVFKVREDAPRVVIANSNPAASWAYVGTQEVLQTAFQTFDAVGREHFGGGLAGKLIVSGGMGAAGGALPLAAGLLGAAFLGIEVDSEKIRRRIRAGYCDYCVNSLDEALRILKNAVRQKHAVSVGLVGNCAEVIPELATRGVVPNILIDQTSTHNLLNGYIPSGLNTEQAAMLRRENPIEYLNRARESVARQLSGMLALQELGSLVLGFGNDFRTLARECGIQDAFKLPGLADSWLQPLLHEDSVPVRWVALSGVAEDIRRFDDLAIHLFPDDSTLARWIPLARKFLRFQGLPARVCWLGQEARIALAEHVNQFVAGGVLKAPVVIALDSMNSRLARMPRAESQRAEEEATSGSPDLLALLNAASGANWISLATGEDPCLAIATVALVADGTPQASKHIPRVLKNDYAAGILRLARGVLQIPPRTPRRKEP